ncbi:uncharacterized protein LOC110412243 [Herrania umbratica]|uniref:Uncharacterized protein LOC110412243 n=1 Tax=Herrania umbratica TaxID=108875 RepID=A0A6J0ZUH5_9ROSI|nr:uncharacterized protein LOC110412243 [Herrania umbratica]
MGDLQTLAKARMELEELYLGIPDDSVNLTFQDLADMKPKANASEKNKSTSVEPLQEAKNPKQASPLTKSSLDFNRGQQATEDHSYYHHKHYLELGYEDANFVSHMDMGHHHHHHHPRHHDGENMHAWDGHRYGTGDQSHRSHATSPRGLAEFRHGVERSVAYDDVSVISMASNYPERGQRHRPGIPHSNICTICTTSIYIFRHRCLVCGRVYCRQCVCIGMGEMTEGRKCILCLGRRFSQRYIKRAGKMGCFSRYPSSVKEAELKWAERGPRRSGERAYGRSAMMPRSRSPTKPRTPTRAHATSAAPSFVASSPAYSPYTPTHHHLPL